METTNTPANVKDPEKLKEIMAKIREANKTKKDAEAFVPPKDEEEVPDADELNEPSKTPQPESPKPQPPKLPPVFDLSEGTIEMILALMIRDEEFFKRYRKWIKPCHFAPMSPAAPLEKMENIFIKAVEFYNTYGNLIPKVALINEIREHLKSAKDDEDRKYEWYDFIEELYALNLTSPLKDYSRDKMIKFITHQATKEEIVIFGKEKLGGGNLIDVSEASAFSKRIAEIAKIGEEEAEPKKIRTCDDVDETIGGESDDWIVRGLIAKNDINVWYAPPGCGKSHLIWILGNSVSDGKECLEIEIHQTPVTYIDLENSEDVRRHFKRLLGGGKMGLITLDDAIDIPNIDSSPEKFEEFILTLPKGVIPIDTFPMITDETKFAESKWEVGPIIKVLRRLCAKGYTFLLIFHSLKADPKTIKAPQELLGRAGHVVSIYNVSDVGEEKELEEIDPNKPRTLFVGTGANLKSRHKKYIYWLKADMNEESEQKGFRRMGSPTDSILEKIQIALRGYLKNKEISEDSADCFPNQTVFIELIRNLLGCSEKKARAYIKQGNGRYWTEKQTGTNFQYYPKR